MTRTKRRPDRPRRRRLAAGPIFGAIALLFAIGASTAVLAASHDINIIDFGYKPATLTVAVGEPVTWSNAAADTHTVTSDTGSELDSGNLVAGQSYGHVFGAPGTYAYHCAIHSQMKGTIIVEAAAPTTQGSGPATPVPPEGTLPPNFSPGASIGPIESQAVVVASPTAQPTAGTQPAPTSDNGLPLIIGVAVAVLIGGTIAYLLARGRT